MNINARDGMANLCVAHLSVRDGLCVSGMEVDLLKIQSAFVTIDQRLQSMEDNLSRIIDHLQYMPGGPGYFEAKSDFESCDAQLRITTDKHTA
jgi:hypothetical protein